MESNKSHPTYDEDRHTRRDDDGGPGGVHIGHNEEDNGEKPSMLTKVKAKARKIKNSIKEHAGHGHDHHAHDGHDDEDDDEDDDDEGAKEMDTDPEIYGTPTQNLMPGKEGVGRQHESKSGGKPAFEGSHGAGREGGDYQTFDPTTARYTPGQDETTLGWSRTDTGRPKEFDKQPNAPRNTPADDVHLGGGHSTGGLERGNKGGPVKPGGLTDRPLGNVEEDPHAAKDVWEEQHPANYQAKVTDPTCIGNDSNLDWPSTDTRMPRTEEVPNAAEDTPFAAHSGYDSMAAHSSESFTPGDKTAKGGVIHEPMSKTQGQHYQTSQHATGQDDNLGWSGTDTGILKGSEEMSDQSRYIPITAHLGGTHGVDAEERDADKLGGPLRKSPHSENDPHAPRYPGGISHAENYESKVADPTGKGGEEMGVTPVLHQLDRMHIHEEPQQKQNIRSSQDKISTGSHDQFFPEPITSETSTFLQTPESGSQHLGEQGWHDKSEQKQADKAKQATSSVTSKLGYGDTSDQQSTVSPRLHDKTSEPRGYGETISNATTAIADRAVQAKDVVATKLGYGGTHEEQPVVKESKGGSTMASKVQGSGMERDVGPTTTTGATSGSDKGVSMKEYLVDKLRPGEDDKALSDVITEAVPLHKRKEDVSEAGEEGQGKKVTIKGKVTESNEVARQFGRGEETNYDDAGTGLASPGKGVMDRILEATNFWSQKSGVSPAKDIPEGKEGSSSVVSSEEDGQYKVNKSTLNV